MYVGYIYIYMFTLSSCVWVYSGVEILSGPCSCCCVVPLCWCAG
jgi:hypothetical protein